MKGRIFSGVQPSGNLTLGNYLGAIKNFVSLQQDFECIYCAVDLHAITVWQDPKILADQTRAVVAGYLAAGIDPKESIVFNQSAVSAHAELAWVFNCVSRLGWLNRMTQFKDKAGKNKEKVSSGLYVYPNLMAADILIYQATHVPVGDDQKQHLELTRDIAAKFNNDFETELFPIVEPLIFGAATRVMSLRDGSKKMSKSDPSDYSRINLNDDADTIVQKVRKAKTDSELLPGVDVLNDNGDFSSDFRSARPEAANLLTLFAAIGDQALDATLAQFEGKEFSSFKSEFADLAAANIGPIGQEMQRLLDDPTEIDRVLKDGAERAAAIAEPILKKTYEAVGFLRP